MCPQSTRIWTDNRAWHLLLRLVHIKEIVVVAVCVLSQRIRHGTALHGTARAVRTAPYGARSGVKGSSVTCGRCEISGRTFLRKLFAWFACDRVHNDKTYVGRIDQPYRSSLHSVVSCSNKYTTVWARGSTWWRCTWPSINALCFHFSAT